MLSLGGLRSFPQICGNNLLPQGMGQGILEARPERADLTIVHIEPLTP